MQRITEAPDISGRALFKGDTVSTTNGQLTGKIWDLADDDGMAFVQLKPVHQPYARPVWYASDQVIWIATAKSVGRSENSSSNGKSSAPKDLDADRDPDSPNPLGSQDAPDGKLTADSRLSPARQRNGSTARKK